MGNLEAIAVVIGLIVIGLNQMGLLDFIKPKSAQEVAASLELADRNAERLEAKVTERDKRIAELELQRTNEPVIQVIGQVADIASQTLTKLAAFNGSLQHINDGLGETRDGLRDTVQAMQTLTARVAELHGLPVESQTQINLIRKEI